MYTQYTLHGERIKLNPKNSRIKLTELLDDHCMYSVDGQIIFRKYVKKLGPLATGEVSYDFSFRDKYILYDIKKDAYYYVEEGHYRGMIYKKLNNEFELNVYCFKCCENKHNIVEFLNWCKSVNDLVYRKN